MSETWSWADIPGHAVPEQPRTKEERRRLVIKLRQQGEPIGVVAKMLGVGRNTVVACLKSNAPVAPSEPKTHPEHKSLGHHSLWNEERECRVRKMLQSGMSLGEIARAINVSDNALRHRVEKICPEWKPAPVGAKSQWTPERDAKLTELHGSGMDAKEIAAKLGVSASNVHRRIEHLGLEKPDNPIQPRKASERPELVEALPAGHRISWGALIRGTCLEGLPYPGSGAG